MKRTQHYRMKNQLWRRVFVAILVIIVLCVCSLYVIQHKPTTLKSEPKAVKHTAKPASEGIIKNLNQNVLLKNNNLADSFNTQLKDSGFIGTALIVQHNHVILQQGFGYADKKENRLNDAQSLYQIASIQKGFTATLIMQQIHAGKLQLNTLLSQYYPNIPDADKVTIKEMLTMTSGLTGKMDANVFTTEAENVAFDAEHTTVLNSSKWSYQAINYRLLSGILMKITHKSYSDLFNETFNKKYHLNVLDYKDFMVDPHRTIGYKNADYSQLASEKPLSYAFETGTGNMAMSAGNLYTFYRLLTDHVILNEELLNMMWQHPVTSRYAAGLYHFDEYNTGHGLELGFEPTVILTKNGQDAVILMSNENTTGKSWQPLAKHLFAQMTAIKIIK
ncbi:beta-lactamase family protein [Leuconostoc gelidum subsp. gasicomitatum]|uniref:serine hydrolase domain-containing protein n=1 Tax=Leuconostoc gasicomitatum TaxID=115778 RepID=UPI0007E073C4|nr:serine hydrolase domain-containing protein [Leuconostoc gasicomitatum]MBZ5947012.1 beta-lactamase family protein [Leuconostoc gasicomitatum]CUW19642.1 Beta-lactamase class C and other penicillin binding proteins [Leuconostoc gasicomitatum]